MILYVVSILCEDFVSPLILKCINFICQVVLYFTVINSQLQINKATKRQIHNNMCNVQCRFPHSSISYEYKHIMIHFKYNIIFHDTKCVVLTT